MCYDEIYHTRDLRPIPQWVWDKVNEMEERHRREQEEFRSLFKKPGGTHGDTAGHEGQAAQAIGWQQARVGRGAGDPSPDALGRLARIDGRAGQGFGGG